MLPSARQCFDAGLRANSLARARGCLDAREVLGDDAGAVRDARRRLAQRWLAIGDERLGAGNLAGAEAALASARFICDFMLPPPALTTMLMPESPWA